MVKMRIIPAFLVLCVIFAIVPRPGAAAAGMSGLEVTGQTAMTQQTFTDLSVIGADSCGLTDAINGAKNPAQTIGEWIKGYWDSWLLRQQLTWGTALNIAAAGARYTGNGDLLFNSQLSDLFTRFYNWLWDGEDGPNIIQYAETLPGEELDVGYVDMSNANLNNLYYPNAGYAIQYSDMVTCSGGSGVGERYEISAYNGDAIILTGTKDNYQLYAVNDKSIFVGISWYEGNNLRNSWNVTGGSIVTAKNGSRYYIRGLGHVAYPFKSCTVSFITPNLINNNTLADIAYLIFNNGVEIGDDQILGDPDKLGGLTGSERKRVAPPDLLDFPDFGGNSGTIDVSDYLGGLRGAIESEDGTADVNITNSEGVESTETMTIDQTSDIPAETETTAEAVNQGELISTATPSTELADYTIDLRNYFPFCIPWDLYDMITLLVAEPVAPHVQYPFVIEPLNVNYTIDLDFSQFDSVATVLRTMELLAAGIGLALMTKRLIQGGD